MELMHTLLPLPVEPAIIRWGKLARSITTGAPPVSWPMAIGRPPEAATFLNGALSITSLSITRVGEGLGTSIPTRASPGTGASRRRYGVFRASARSFSRARMLCTFTRPPSPLSGPSAASAPLFRLLPLLGTHPGTNPNLNNPRTGFDVIDGYVNAVLPQGALNQPGHVFQGRCILVPRLGGGEQLDGRQNPTEPGFARRFEP